MIRVDEEQRSDNPFFGILFFISPLSEKIKDYITCSKSNILGEKTGKVIFVIPIKESPGFIQTFLKGITL